MRCVSCGQQAQVIDVTDEPVFLEQHLSFLSGDINDPENHHEMVIQVNADRCWGLRGNRRLQVCKECLSGAYMNAVEELFEQRGIPQLLEGERKG